MSFAEQCQDMSERITRLNSHWLAKSGAVDINMFASQCSIPCETVNCPVANRLAPRSMGKFCASIFNKKKGPVV